MFDPLTTTLVATATAIIATRAAARAIPPRRPERYVVPVETGRPRHVDHPMFTWYRGAVRTTQEQAARYLAADPGALYLLAGILWPARQFLNKLVLITGKPDSGKTVLMRLMMESVADLFRVLPAQAKAGLYPGEGRMRWFVVDPTNAYLPLLYQVVPGDVPIIRSTPVDAEGWRWDVRRDITSAALNEALQEGLFPESLFQKAGDPFWYTKAREVAKAVVTVYQERGSAWEFHDLIMPFRYPQFLAHLLAQSPMTKGMAEHELVGRLGRDIISTASSIMNKMAIAAALWQKAERSFSLRDFLDDRAVMHFAYTPDLIPSFAGIANALVRVMVLLGISRIDPYNHTLLWLDEGRYLADLAGLEDLAARGRGAGFGAVFAAQGLPGLINKWGEGRVKELVDLLSTWVALTSGPETAEMFSRAVGKCEGVSRSYSISHTYGESMTEGGNSGQSSSWSFSGSTTHGSSSGTSWSTTTSWSRSESESFQLTVRDAVMPGELTNLPYADAASDCISGFAFNPQVGAFEFAAPFLRHFRELPDPIVGTMPLRPEGDQRLLPWKEEDVTRLKLQATPGLIAAIKKTWEAFGGAA